MVWRQINFWIRSLGILSKCKGEIKTQSFNPKKIIKFTCKFLYYCLLTFLDCLTALALKVCVLTLVFQVFFTLKLNSRFLHSVFDLTTHNSYFTILVEVFTKHILAENTQFTNHTEWTEHKMTKTKQLTIQTFICYLIYFGSRKLFHKIIQHTFHSRHTTCNFETKKASTEVILKVAVP